MIYQWVLTRVIRRVPHAEQKLVTVPEYFSSPPVFSEVRVAQSLSFLRNVL
jgi:hypothetical protein